MSYQLKNPILQTRETILLQLKIRQVHGQNLIGWTMFRELMLLFSLIMMEAAMSWAQGMCGIMELV